jgi:hypothetical protein
MGVLAQVGGSSNDPARVSLTRTIVERCYEEGVRATGAEVDLDAVLVRDVLPSAADDSFGRGVNAFVLDGVAPRVSVRSSVIERTHEAGINLAGGDLVVERSVVRDTRAQKAQGLVGYGIVAHPDADAQLPAGVVELRWSLIEGTEGVGVMVTAAGATLEGLVVRGGKTGPAGDGGRGINVQLDAHARGSDATLQGLVLEDNSEFGLVVIDAAATVRSTRVTGTRSNALDLFGDGVAVISQGPPASVDLARVLVEGSARAGLATFSALARITSTTFECNAIDLDGEQLGGPFELDDGGGNACGCEGTAVACTVLSSNMAPPTPLPTP